MTSVTGGKLLEQHQSYIIQPESQLSNGKGFGSIPKRLEQLIKMNQFRLKNLNRFRQLTDREVEILALLANGSNNPQIAERLFISRKTVETHRKNLKAKLDIRSLLDLMRYAFAFDLVEC